MLYFPGLKEHYSLFAASATFFATLKDEDELSDISCERGRSNSHSPNRLR